MAFLCHIDRSASARALVAELAGNTGWQVASFSDIGEAITEIQARIPDLIVAASTHVSSDHLAETVAALRSDPRIAAIPIVLLTGTKRRDTVSSAMEMGVAEVFFKEELDAFRKYLIDVAACYPGAEQHQHHVLVLDDDRAIGALIQHILKSRGIQVDLRRSIPAALSAAREGQYEVVIADIVLADDRSGNHFIRQVRRLGGRYATLPIVAISAFLDSARRIDSLRAGATLCIAKPVEHAELVLVIERLLYAANPVPASESCAGCEPNEPELPDLTGREGLVCRLAVKGTPDKEIARRLGISYWTVRTYMGRIFQKYGVANRVELASRCLGNDSPTPSEPPLQPPQGAWHEISADVVHHLDYGVVVTDADQKILWVNPAFSKVTGYEASEVIGKTPRLWRSDKQDPLFYKDMFGQLNSQGHWSGELWNRNKHGGLFLEALEIRSLPPGSPQNARYVGLIADITERHLGIERVRHSALHDPLTGLANRALLWDRAAQAMAHAQRSKKSLAVAFVDLDRFKPINDTLGHDAGDAVLVEVARRLRTRLRDSDTLARYGGDEFVVVLPEVGSRARALGVAAKLLQACSDPVQCKGHDVTFSASIGLSFYPDDGADVDALITASDRAMYQAKGMGGGQVRVFERASDAALENRRYPLQQALERGDFLLHFQPMVDVQSRKTIAAEVVLRLMDPHAGIVYPAEILPLAERSGFMPSLDRWIFHEACKCLRRIQNSGFRDFSLAINIAPAQVLDGAFADHIDAVIADTGVCASSVQLDIPGAVFSHAESEVCLALERLARTGVCLVFDDFGMGCAGPGCLKHASFEGLKVDRRLIAGAHSDRFNAAVVRSVFGLAGDLGIAAVAKGVEGARDLDFLADLGCTVAQGFLFAPPMLETELMAWLFASDIASETFD